VTAARTRGAGSRRELKCAAAGRSCQRRTFACRPRDGEGGAQRQLAWSLYRRRDRLAFFSWPSHLFCDRKLALSVAATERPTLRLIRFGVPFRSGDLCPRLPLDVNGGHSLSVPRRFGAPRTSRIVDARVNRKITGNRSLSVAKCFRPCGPRSSRPTRPSAFGASPRYHCAGIHAPPR
jgi:hypothetical protein